MFYRALGYAVWKLAMRYLRERFGRRLRVAVVLGASLAVAGYLATRSSGE